MKEQIPVLDENGDEQLDEDGKVITKSGKLIIDVIKDNFAHIDEQTGYTLVGQEVLDAVDYGVPQHRERIFLVGVRNDLVETIKWKYPVATHGDKRIPYLTIKEAISDLPSLSEGESKNLSLIHI